MIIINPQWQGIGRPNPVSQGRNTLRTLLSGFALHEVPLDESALETAENVKGLPQIETLIEKTQNIIDAHKPNKIFTCGGDCSSDFAQLTYLSELYQGDFTLIWIDAHADLNTPESSPSQNFHGMTLRCLTGEGAPALTKFVRRPLSPSRLVFSGLRSVDPEEVRYLEEHKIPVYKTQETIEGAIENIRFTSDNIYIHVDIDSLDESVFNHCATPTSGGFDLKSLTRLINYLASRYNVIGGALTEYGPKTPDAAIDIVHTILFEGFDLNSHYADDLETASPLKEEACC